MPLEGYSKFGYVDPTSITRTWMLGHAIVLSTHVFPRELLKASKYGVGCYKVV